MNKKQFILDNISEINSNQCDEIIDIIKENDIKYMQNNYGIFLSLNKVSIDIVDTIYEHIKYCLEHKAESKIENNFEKDNLKCINDFLKKQKEPEQPIIEKKIKKNILPDTNNTDIIIQLTDPQYDIIMLSKQLKIECN